MQNLIDDEELDRQLGEALPYIDDAGFTSRVVQKLPARHVRRSYRAVLLLGITLAACIMAFWLAGGTSLAFDTYANVAMLPVMWMWIFAALVGVLVMVAGLAAAVSRTRGRSR